LPLWPLLNAIYGCSRFVFSVISPLTTIDTPMARHPGRQTVQNGIASS
jgi:hypothetical protein